MDYYNEVISVDDVYLLCMQLYSSVLYIARSTTLLTISLTNGQVIMGQNVSSYISKQALIKSHIQVLLLGSDFNLR